MMQDNKQEELIKGTTKEELISCIQELKVLDYKIAPLLRYLIVNEPDSDICTSYAEVLLTVLDDIKK